MHESLPVFVQQLEATQSVRISKVCFYPIKNKYDDHIDGGGGLVAKMATTCMKNPLWHSVPPIAQSAKQ